MHLLVTGRSGVGKTTVCNTLEAMNMPAFDADRVEGLSAWVDVKTHKPVVVDYTQPIDKRRVGWFWAEPVLSELLSAHKDVILCGSADNQLEYYPFFDKVIFLSLPPDEQARRIAERTEHNYGKTPGMIRQILREQAVLRTSPQALGSIIMNADRPPDQIAFDIIRHLK